MTDHPLDTKGKRPAFFSDPALDSMMTALLEVMAENWSLKERLYALEKALKTDGVLKEEAVENVSWSDDEKMAHEVERQRILTDSFRALKGDFVGRAARVNDIDA
jgi:hypothetical protein